MKIAMLILAIMGILGGVFGTLALLTFGMMAGANASPEDIRKIKLFLLTVSVVGLLIIGGGVGLMYIGRPGLASIVGVFPLVFVVGWMLILGIQQAMR